MIVLQHRRHIREGCETLLEDAVNMRDGNAVVYDGHLGIHSRVDAAFHHSFVEHTSAAVDDHLVIFGIFGEFAAGCE